jgi:hypothetical protein
MKPDTVKLQSALALKGKGSLSHISLEILEVTRGYGGSHLHGFTYHDLSTL